MRGGDLDLEYRKEEHIFMTGPAVLVFEGNIPI
jgi:diaminopimelate epimerase